MRLNVFKKDSQHKLFVLWNKNGETEIIIVRLTKTTKLIRDKENNREKRKRKEI